MALPYCIPYFDAHCDTVTKFRSLRRSGRDHLDLTRLGKYSPAAQVFALWAPPGVDGPRTFRRLIGRLEGQLEKNRDLAVLCTRPEQVEAAARENRTAVFASVEGANLLGCRVAGLTDAYRRGVRMVTLCWNRDNLLCGSCLDGGGGLTADGERFTDACWELGVAVDLSHASERTFWDVIRRSRRPVLCSHSNAQALCGHPRNITDAQIAAVIHNDGCIGLNLCREFVGGAGDMEAVLAQVDYFLCQDAGENLCLGTDFDGVDRLPEGVAGVESMEALYEALLRRGLRERLVQDIFFYNLRRYLDRAL